MRRLSSGRTTLDERRHRVDVVAPLPDCLDPPGHTGGRVFREDVASPGRVVEGRIPADQHVDRRTGRTLALDEADHLADLVEGEVPVKIPCRRAARRNDGLRGRAPNLAVERLGQASLVASDVARTARSRPMSVAVTSSPEATEAALKAVGRTSVRATWSVVRQDDVSDAMSLLDQGLKGARPSGSGLNESTRTGVVVRVQSSSEIRGGRIMSELDRLEERIEKLSPEELKRFRAWFAEFDARVWDAQIEADSKAGRLDALVAEALAEHKAGKTRER